MKGRGLGSKLYVYGVFLVEFCQLTEQILFPGECVSVSVLGSLLQYRKVEGGGGRVPETQPGRLFVIPLTPSVSQEQLLLRAFLR